MSLVTFVLKYMIRLGKITTRSSSTRIKEVIPVFSPDVHCFNIDHPLFWQYCLLSLIKYKPWEGNISTTYGMTLDHVSLDEYTDDEKVRIIHSFNEYFRNVNSSYYESDNRISRAIIDLFVHGDLTLTETQNNFSIESENSLDGALRQAIANVNSTEDLTEIQWDRDYDFTELQNEYPEDDLN